jgi:Family of unknown function (DUF6082)
MVFGPARELLWIATVYRPFGHVAGTPQVLCRSVACRTGHDNSTMTVDRNVGGRVIAACHFPDVRCNVINMQSALSVIAIVVSSIALIGVVIGLILQNRQVKASQHQVMREMQLEIIKLGIENPALNASVYEGQFDAADVARAHYINLLMHFWQTCFSLKTMTGRAVAIETDYLFRAEFPRTWWAQGRGFFEAEAGTKSEKEFYKIVDSIFEQVEQTFQASP